jgi:hypothetical protein
MAEERVTEAGVYLEIQGPITTRVTEVGIYVEYEVPFEEEEEREINPYIFRKMRMGF